MTYSIRYVQACDAPAIVRLGREGIEGTAYDGVVFSVQRVMDSMVECIDRPQTFFGLCGFRDGELVGLKYAYATQYFFSTDIVCYDLATYVTPSARSFALIKMMIREYIRWSKLVGAKRVYLGATSMPGDPRVGTLFTKLGFEPAGSLHVMEIDYGQRLAATG